MDRTGDQTTIEKGDSFRDAVVSMLRAAGFFPETEVREQYKKVDARWLREDIDGQLKYVVETKDHAGALGMRECGEFATEYGGLVDNGVADRAWLVSKGPFTPDGRDLVDRKRNCKAMTFAEFQRRLLGLDNYLQELITSYDAARIAEWYIPPHTEDGNDLENVVREWIDDNDALPLAIVAGYGKGKSTFARHMAAALAREALKEPSRRVPVLVPLGDIVDEQSLEGLLGKIFTSRPGVRDYNFGLFERLNNAGRYVVFFDGFDEMKHGMTLTRFEANITELMRLDKEAAKVVILGRDTAFQDDYEFKSIIQGRQITAGGQEARARDRRPFREVTVRNFIIAEAKRFVKSYFPVVAKDAARGVARPPNEIWITARLAELLNGEFDDLLVRPVHAQMLCQIATDPDLSLKGLSKYRLFDFFVHFLLDREVKKRGRDAAFSLDVRRQFNRALAFWLWSQGGISTVSLASIPAEICRGAAKGISHEYDDEALRKELTAGCLIEKGATGTIYFGHRSLQEFLVAEHLIETDLERASIEDKKEALDALGLITPEVGSFIVEATQSSKATRNTVLKWFGVLKNLRRKDMPRLGMRFFMDLYSLFPDTVAGRANDPWFIWLKYFTANGAVEFAPKAGAAVGQLSALLQFLDGTKDQQTATLILFAEALSRPSDIRTRSAEQFIAKWLNPNMLRDALSTARGIKSGDHHYVSMEQNFLLWTFLYAAKEIGSVPPRVVVDLRELRRRAGAALVMGFADEQDENLPEETRFLNVSAQGIYRAWGIREADLEKLRPFFTDPGLRSKIRPLEIVRTGRQGGDQAVTFVKAAARQPLTLKKRGGPNARGQ